MPIQAKKTWTLESVDTVKYSRDLARQYEKDASYDETIDLQIKAIASSGANYIAIGTPYDKEFIPFLTRWVTLARKYGLKVWFRGNFSGWESWFGYSDITRDEHKKLLKSFILDNGNLFEDGDVFTACTECENGGPGDPRRTGDTAGHRQFLIDEYQIGRNAFAQIGKNVATNYFPMNADVAKLIMDPPTTQALGGLVVIDHYVPTPQGLDQGVTDLAVSSGGKVVLGEFGAPIPDLQGNLTDRQQADWIKSALILLSNNPYLIGVNYWTSFGGSTSIWHNDGSPTPSVAVINSFYNPKVLVGIVQNEAGQFIKNAKVTGSIQTTNTNANGEFVLAYIENTPRKIVIEADGYKSQSAELNPGNKYLNIVLKKEYESLFFKLQKLLHKYLGI